MEKNEKTKKFEKIIGLKNWKKEKFKIEIKKIDKKLKQDKRLEKFIIKNWKRNIKQ